ncbi:MAG: hypothetical protein II821_02435 [Treponema sp.]|nr:hypothetical protein [Treponema sp.]
MERDSFEVMASGISDYERQSMLSRINANDNQDDSGNGRSGADDDSDISIEVKLKNEPFILRLLVWLKAVLSNTSKTVIYNEFKLSEISRFVHHNYPGLIDYKQGLFLSFFFEKLTELKTCVDFFRPYIISTIDCEGAFYVFLSTIVMPETDSEIKHDTDPYATPVSAELRPDLRVSLLHKLEDIFENIPERDKGTMYMCAKATEWLKRLIRLPFGRFISMFSSAGGRDNTCPFGQVDTEVGEFTQLLSDQIEIPDEFWEALYFFAVRNSKFLNNEENGRDAGEFITKARTNINLINMFINSVPLRSLGCIVNNDAYWHALPFSGGEDWFVKFKNESKRTFELKWSSWENDCKREALLSTLKVTFELEQFPLFPQRPWEEVWGGVPFLYDPTLGFLAWFMKEKFPECELDFKTLLVQGSFIKKDNHAQFAENFNAMIQLSISLQELGRRLSENGEIGSTLHKMREDTTRTLQAQNKLEQTMRGIESDVATLIHRFEDAGRMLSQLLNGILGYSKDKRFDTISNLNKMKDQNNEPFINKIEKAKGILESALSVVIELENLDKKKNRK